MIKMTIPGPPRGKGRPRFTRTGHPYTPAETRTYEKEIGLRYKEAARQEHQGPAEYMEGPVAVKIVACFPIPKRATKKEREAINRGQLSPTKKPDVDNVVKAVLDGLNGVAFRDDAQVCVLNVIKLYSTEPRVTVLVHSLDEREEGTA